MLALADKLNTPGEHPFFFEGLTGQAEAVLTLPPNANEKYLALLGHPHSLQGGTMNNKVVTTMARAFKELGIPSLRFNFRGVGLSGGQYDAGLGESEDMLVLKRLWQETKPDTQFIFAGFSFGSYVAYRAAAQSQSEMLITIAPAVHHYNYREFNPAPNPWFIIHGDEDEVVPLNLVLDFVKEARPGLSLSRFSDSSHFFHGKLIELKAELIRAIKQELVL